MILLTFLLIPTFIALGAFLFGQNKVTWQEFVVQLVAQVLLISGFYSIMLWTNTRDTEVWNGRVALKKHERVHCRHSYTCNCYTSCSGSGSNQSCTTICQTCYEHGYDIDWLLKTTNNETIDIDTIDRQGLREPPRWTRAQIGDTTSVKHSYENYIKASPNSLFRRTGLVEKYPNLPSYPLKVYDYHYLDRTVSIGVSLRGLNLWNKELSELNSSLGRQKEVNVVLVVTKNQPEDYFYALEQHWIGGKKNDVIIVADVNDSETINWVNTMAWTDAHIFKVNMRDSLLKLKKLDRELVLPTVHAVVLKDYVRKPMKDFEYLKQSITPTKGQYIGLTIFGLLLSLGISWFVFKNDVFDTENNYRRYR